MKRRLLLKKPLFHTPRTAFIRKAGKRKRRFFIPSGIKIILILVLIIGIISATVYFFFFSEIFTIRQSLIIRDGNAIESAEFTSLFGVFRGQRTFFLDTKDILKKILAHHPEIQIVKTRTRLPSTLILEITTYPPSANIINQSRTGIKKLIINSNGLAIEEDTQDPSLPYVRLITREAQKINTRVIKKEHLDFMTKSYAIFNELFSMKISEILYKKAEREAHLKTERGFLIWMDIEKDPGKQLAKLKLILPKLNIYEAKLGYIDLRISGVSGEKIFYK